MYGRTGACSFIPCLSVSAFVCEDEEDLKRFWGFHFESASYAARCMLLWLCFTGPCQALLPWCTRHVDACVDEYALGLLHGLSLPNAASSSRAVSGFVFPLVSSTRHCAIASSTSQFKCQVSILVWTRFRCFLSTVVSRSASAAVWCLLVPVVVADGGLVVTQGGLFGSSG